MIAKGEIGDPDIRDRAEAAHGVETDQAVDDLTQAGVTFETYDLGNGAAQDSKGVLRGLSANMGPDIAWFKDPAGNILAVLQTA